MDMVVFMYLFNNTFKCTTEKITQNESWLEKLFHDLMSPCWVYIA